MKVRTMIAISLIASLFAACSTSKTLEKKSEDLAATAPATDIRSGIDAVPTDAVFLISSNGPLNQRLAGKLYELLTVELKTVESASRGNLSRFNLFDRPSGRYFKELASLITEKLGATEERKTDHHYDWGAAGLSPTPEVLFYNVGFAQVARISLQKPEVFAQLLDQADGKVEKVSKLDVEGITIRTIPESNSASRNRASLVFAIVKNELLVGQVPTYYAENPEFWPLFIGDSAKGGLGHKPVTLPNPMPLTPNSLTGFFSFKTAFDQILNQQKSPSGKFLYDFFAHSKEKVSERCRSVMADYPIENNDVAYLGVETDGLATNVALQLPVEDATAQALQKSMRPPLPESEESRKILEKALNFDLQLNFNLYDFLDALNHAVDDEIILASQCSGRFEYTAGSFGLLIAPMKSLLQLVDSTKFGYDGTVGGNLRALLATVKSSDPQTLLRGLSSLIGVSNIPATIPENTPIPLDFPGNIQVPFPKPLQASLAPGRLALFAGGEMRSYLDAEGKGGEDSQLGPNTPLFSYRYKTLNNLLNYDSGVVIKAEGKVLKKGPLNILFSIVEPKKE